MRSKRTKALAITQKTKKEVWERDQHRCIFCGRYVPESFANSHFIKRSHGGLGIPQNILTNCLECHRKFDDGEGRAEMLSYAETYLKSKYREWNRDDLTYKKIF